MKPDSANLFEFFAYNIGQLRATVRPRVKDSGKLARAVEELEEIEGYLWKIAKLPDRSQRERQAIGLRLIGCAGLLDLAACDISLRIRGSKVLREASRMLAVYKSELHRHGQDFAKGVRDTTPLCAAQRAAELVSVERAMERRKQ